PGEGHAEDGFVADDVGGPGADPGGGPVEQPEATAADVADRALRLGAHAVRDPGEVRVVQGGVVVDELTLDRYVDDPQPGGERLLDLAGRLGVHLRRDVDDGGP